MGDRYGELEMVKGEVPVYQFQGQCWWCNAKYYKSEREVNGLTEGVTTVESTRKTHVRACAHTHTHTHKHVRIETILLSGLFEH